MPRENNKDQLAEDVAEKVVGALRASHSQLENLAGIVAEMSLEVKTITKELDSISRVVRGNGASDPLITQIRLVVERTKNLEKKVDEVKEEFTKKVDAAAEVAQKMEEKKLDVWKIIAGAIATIAATIAAALGFA